MHETLFCGKNKKTGEWIYGNLIQLKNDGIPRTFIFNPDKLDMTEIYDFAPSYEPEEQLKNLFIEVFPKTVGEYIGLKDKDGEKIYKGDVVQLGNKLWYVYWNKYKWDIKGINTSLGYGLSLKTCLSKCKKVGNIHNNPELLKRG